MTERFLVDTNILLFALTDIEKDKQQKAKDLISENYSNSVISIQNMIEFANVITSKFTKNISPDIVVKLLNSIKSSFSILNIDEYTVISATILSKKYSIHFFDALLAKTMLENNITIIYTVNESDFIKIPGIKVINPFK